MFPKPKLTDNVVFSYLMSTTGAEPAVESFINATLEDDGHPPIKNVQILNPFTMSNFKDGKVSILDVKVQDQDGRFFNVEMQTANKIGFKERILYYASKLYASQLVKGDGYEKLMPVIPIIVARFTMIPELLGQHNVFMLRAKRDPSVVFSEQIQVHSLELTKKQLPGIPAVSPRLFNWFDFLINGHEKTESEMSSLFQDPGLAIAAENYNQFCQSAELRELAWVQEKTERDRISEIGYLLQEAREEAREEGVGIGIKKTILRNFSHRYPQADSSEIQQILQSIDTEDDLNYLQDLFFDCPTASEFMIKAREIK